jgi:hypothetical protein
MPFRSSGAERRSSSLVDDSPPRRLVRTAVRPRPIHSRAASSTHPTIIILTIPTGNRRAAARLQPHIDGVTTITFSKPK